MLWLCTEETNTDMGRTCKRHTDRTRALTGNWAWDSANHSSTVFPLWFIDMLKKPWVSKKIQTDTNQAPWHHMDSTEVCFLGARQEKIPNKNELINKWKDVLCLHWKSSVHILLCKYRIWDSDRTVFPCWLKDSDLYSLSVLSARPVRNDAAASDCQ